MRKLFTLVAFAVTLLSFNGVFAQCTINTSDTTIGFSPDPAPFITQGVAYGQTIQVYVPSSYDGFAVDSVHVASIGSGPTGLTYTFNPASGTVPGGGHGCIWVSGTTTDTVGTYTLSFTGTVYTSITNISLSTLASQFHYSLTVVAAAAACDTIENFTDIDTPEIFTWESPSVGFLSGSGALSESGQSLPQTDVAEEFSATAGNYVTAAEIFFGYVTINTPDSDNTVTVYLYDTLGMDVLGDAGAPGNALDSSKITLRLIAAAVSVENGNLVSFPNQPALPSKHFFIAVSLPSNTGDTLAVLTTTGTTIDGHGWLGVEGDWISYDSLVGGIVQLGDYIAVSVCPAQSLPPNAAFSNAASACAGTSVAFTDQSTQSPLEWAWTFGDGGTASSQSPTHTYSSAGTYTVVEYAANANGTTLATGTITVNASPTATVTVKNASSNSSDNGDVVVTAHGAGGYTYVWGGHSSTTDSLGGVGPGTYSVTITDANHCTVADSGTVTVSGINTLNDNVTVKIYPNPSSDQLNFQWSLNAEADLVIYDATGKFIKSFVVNGTGVNALDIHELAAGNYVLLVTDRQNNAQRSVMFSKM